MEHDTGTVSVVCKYIGPNPKIVLILYHSLGYFKYMVHGTWPGGKRNAGPEGHDTDHSLDT